jgi:hypothetical protein
MRLEQSHITEAHPIAPTELRIPSTRNPADAANVRSSVLPPSSFWAAARAAAGGSAFRGSLTRRLSVEGDHQRHGFRVGDGTTDATK